MSKMIIVFFTWTSFQVGETDLNLIPLNQKCWRLMAVEGQRTAATLPVSGACFQSVITFRTGGQTWIGQRAHLPVCYSGVSQVVVTWFPHSTSIAPLLEVCLLKEKLGLMIKLHSWNVEALYDLKWNVILCLYPKQPKKCEALDWELYDVLNIVCWSHSTDCIVTHFLQWLTLSKFLLLHILFHRLLFSIFPHAFLYYGVRMCAERRCLCWSFAILLSSSNSCEWLNQAFLKEIYCTESIYIVYKDKFQNCSLNHFE